MRLLLLILLMKGAHMYCAVLFLVIATAYCLTLTITTYNRLTLIHRLPSKYRVNHLLRVRRLESTLRWGLVSLASLMLMISTIIILIGV